MKKEVLKVLFLCFAMFLSLCVFAACNDSNASHVHVYGEGIITKVPTCTEKGEKTFTCFCGVSRTEEIPLSAHEYINGECKYCHGYDEDYCEEIYTDLRAEMITMENKVNSFETIERYLSVLPKNYKDVEKIKDDLIFLKAQYSVFSNAQFCNLMKMLIADTTSDEYKEYYVDCHKVRQAYLNLINSQAEYPEWNVVNIADDYVFTSDSNGILLYVFVGLWQDDDGNYINVIENENNSLSFSSNLPNAKDNSEEYYYFIDGRVIGYSLKSDIESKISAYRIVEIKADHIKVFCFENSKYYTLFGA